MQWLSLDTKVQTADTIFRGLIDEDEGAYCRFELLCCLAKEAADIDPERWQGHLVSATFRPLTVEDFARAYAYTGRNRVTKMQDAVLKLQAYGLLEWCKEHACWLIVDWFRWFKKSAKPSTERVQRYRARLKDKQPETKETFQEGPVATRPPYPTLPNPTPKPPQGERPAGIQNPPEGPDALDPSEPIDEREAERMNLPASTDKSKLSAFLTVAQQLKLRQRCAGALQTIDPVLGSRAREKLFREILEVLPPKGYEHTPQHWATMIAEAIDSGVDEVKHSQTKVKFPADLALSIASRIVGEALSEYAA